MREILDPLLPLWGICEHEGNAVIAAVFPYLLPEPYYTGRNVSRYAVPRDYHGVCGARLERACALLRGAFPGEEFRWHCDSTSLPEAELAVKAGLGTRGRHNLLITREYGSWVFLGEIITSAKPIPMLNAECSILNSCDNCGACVKACPTGALSDNGFARKKCLSYITQKKGSLALEEEALIRQAGAAWGCDICQEVCPRNRGVKIDPLPEFLIDPIAHVGLGTPMEGRAWAWRGEGVIKRNLGLLL